MSGSLFGTLPRFRVPSRSRAAVHNPSSPLSPSSLSLLQVRRCTGSGRIVPRRPSFLPLCNSISTRRIEPSVFFFSGQLSLQAFLFLPFLIRDSWIFNLTFLRYYVHHDVRVVQIVSSKVSSRSLSYIRDDRETPNTGEIVRGIRFVMKMLQNVAYRNE